MGKNSIGAISGNIRQYLEIMLIPPKYFLTPKISRLLSKDQRKREVLISIDLFKTLSVQVYINITNSLMFQIFSHIK